MSLAKVVAFLWDEVAKKGDWLASATRATEKNHQSGCGGSVHTPLVQTSFMKACFAVFSTLIGRTVLKNVNKL